MRPIIPWTLITLILVAILTYFWIQEFYLLPDALLDKDSRFIITLSDLIGLIVTVLIATIVSVIISQRFSARDDAISECNRYLTKISDLAHKIRKEAHAEFNNPGRYSVSYFATELDEAWNYIALLERAIKISRLKLPNKEELDRSFRKLNEAFGESHLQGTNCENRINQIEDIQRSHSAFQVAISVFRAGLRN